MYATDQNNESNAETVTEAAIVSSNQFDGCYLCGK